MRTSILMIFLPIALLLVFPVHATPPLLATGTIAGNGGSTVTMVRTSGNNTFETATGMLTFTGGIQGEGPTTTTAIIHNSTGLAEVRIQIAFSGTVMGSQPGSMNILFIGDFTGFGSSFTTLRGHLVLGDGTGGLTGIHGQGTLVGTSVSSSPTYSVNIHFDPA
jgi:hypothetical protein